MTPLLLCVLSFHLNNCSLHVDYLFCGLGFVSFLACEFQGKIQLEVVLLCNFQVQFSNS